MSRRAPLPRYAESKRCSPKWRGRPWEFSPVEWVKAERRAQAAIRRELRGPRLRGMAKARRRVKYVARQYKKWRRVLARVNAINAWAAP